MNATNITFGNDSFDIITVFTLFSSIIDPDIQKNIAKKLSNFKARWFYFVL